MIRHAHLWGEIFSITLSEACMKSNVSKYHFTPFFCTYVKNYIWSLDRKVE
jgi:hypothetical protein